MGNEFEEVVPGVMVNTRKGWKVQVPHPDPVWIIRNKDDTALVGNQGILFVFSSEELAKKYMEKAGIPVVFPKRLSWDECVDKFSSRYSEVLVDHTGEPGFYSNVPLRKGI